MTIITGMGLDTPPHQKSLKTNHQNINGDIFQPTTKQPMTLMASPKLMAMPANLTSFCLASTYDRLPSPTNLKRWDGE